MSITVNSSPSVTSTLPSLTTSEGAPVVNSTITAESSTLFLERRAAANDSGLAERRQFASSHSELSPDARELAVAIDRYKLEFRRRYITCEEMLAVVKQLGYHRDSPMADQP